MYNSRKKPIEDVQEEMTLVWSCTNENCNGWMRDNFTFSDQPVCPQCQSKMEKTTRKLAVVENKSPLHSH